MPGNPICLFLALACMFSTTPVSAQQLQRLLVTEKDMTRDNPVAHQLSWWTENPLRYDTSGDLMLGFKAPDGQPITAKDYRTEEKIVTVGTLAGHKIVQILITIHPAPRVIAAGFAAQDVPPGEWKDLLVGSGEGDMFIEIYALHFDSGGLIKETTAEIYGSGANAVLGSFDPDTGNGGGCYDGYWWFDKEGAHEVDFSPLIAALQHAIPADATFTPNCWALHPKTFELKSWVHRIDAECHSCGGLGEVRAHYRIERGAARALSISFTPEDPQ